MSSTLSFTVDPRTHFPVVEVPGQDFALFWLPLTRVQIEYFLADTQDGQFDRSWYDRLQKASPRITAEEIVAQNLPRAFLTHLTFYEARVFSKWYEGFDLPTAEEWQRAQHVFAQEPAQPSLIEQILALPKLHPRASLLVQFCEKALPTYQRLGNPARSVAHQMMLSSGILEYVYLDATYNRCGACGAAPFSGNTGQPIVLTLRYPEIGDRRRDLGLRPILRRKG